MARKKKEISEEDVIAMRAFWTGRSLGEGVQQTDPDPEVLHNPHATSLCPCREVRLSGGVKYCKRCWPLAGDNWRKHRRDLNEEWDLTGAHARVALIEES